MARPVANIAETKRVLAPHHERLIRVVLEPFNRWREASTKMPVFMLPFGETERAQILHAHMRFEAKQVFDSVERVMLTEALGFFGMFFEPNLLVRLKYVGNGPQNYPTEQQEKLKKQQYTEDMMACLALDGITEPPTYLTLGYRLSLDASEVRQVVVRRDLKNHPSWEYTIYGEAGSGEGETLPFSFAPRPRPAVLRSKKPKAEPKGDQAT